MERAWTGDPRRLSQVDRLRIDRLNRAGETYATTAAMVGCSTKSIQRYLRLTGGLKDRTKERSPLRLSLGDRGDLSGPDGRRIQAGDRGSAEAVSLDHLPGGCPERRPGRLSRMEC